MNLATAASALLTFTLALAGSPNLTHHPTAVWQAEELMLGGHLAAANTQQLPAWQDVGQAAFRQNTHAI